jgi:hypothetical protein
MAHVAFRVEAAFREEMPPVLVEVQRFLCACSLSADSLLCHFAMEGSRLLDSYKPLPGVFLSQPSPFDDRKTQLLASLVHGLRHEAY